MRALVTTLGGSALAWPHEFSSSLVLLMVLVHTSEPGGLVEDGDVLRT